MTAGVRKKAYSAAWANARNLDWERADVHGMASKWFDRDVTSLTQLSDHELGTMLDRMRQIGGRGAQKSGTDHKLTNTINGLWRRLHSAGAVDDPSAAALSRWVGRQCGAKDGERVLLRTLDARQQSKLVAALQVWWRRVKKESAQHGPGNRIGNSEDTGC